MTGVRRTPSLRVCVTTDTFYPILKLWHNNALILKWKATAKNKARILRVELDPSDTYNMVFQSLQGKEIKRFDGVYADQLKEIFERETALYLSL